MMAVMSSFSAVSHAGVMALGSELGVVATTGRLDFEVTDTASDSQGASTNTLGSMATNAVSSSAGGASITSGSAIATRNNAAPGQVQFEKLGWDNSAFSSGVVSKRRLRGAAWAYVFGT